MLPRDDRPGSPATNQALTGENLIRLYIWAWIRNCRQGTSYTPADVGPLMWIEEQRLFGSVLCIIIFDEVRQMDADFAVLSERSETILISPDDTVEGFWRKIFGGP